MVLNALMFYRASGVIFTEKAEKFKRNTLGFLCVYSVSLWLNKDVFNREVREGF